MRLMGHKACRQRICRIKKAPLQAGVVSHSRLSSPCINRERGSEFRAAR
jgi:hypothetical protein